MRTARYSRAAGAKLGYFFRSPRLLVSTASGFLPRPSGFKINLYSHRALGWLVNIPNENYYLFGGIGINWSFHFIKCKMRWNAITRGRYDPYKMLSNKTDGGVLNKYQIFINFWSTLQRNIWNKKKEKKITMESVFLLMFFVDFHLWFYLFN